MGGLYMALTEKILQWLVGPGTGRSSMTIFCYMEGLDYNGSHPLDPDDLLRCIKLLDIAPKYRERLPQMKELSPIWSRMIDRWDNLENLCRQWNLSQMGYFYHECYAIMKECINPQPEENKQTVWKFDVELAICLSYGGENGPWHTEHVVVEMPKSDPTQYELLEKAEDYLQPVEEFYDIAAIGYYSHSRIITCRNCGRDYDEKYDGECQNTECTESPLYIDKDSLNSPEIIITDITDDISRTDNIVASGEDTPTETDTP